MGQFGCKNRLRLIQDNRVLSLIWSFIDYFVTDLIWYLRSIFQSQICDWKIRSKICKFATEKSIANLENRSQILNFETDFSVAKLVAKFKTEKKKNE